MFKRIKQLAIASLLLCCAVHATTTFAQNDDYKINDAWAVLPDGQTWDGPTSWVGADGKGNVVVMVRVAPYFRVFTRDGQFVRAWGDDGLFQNAHSVTFDPDGNLWATDAASHVVYKFSPDGELLRTLGSKGEAGDNSSTTLFNQPNHVAVAANGDLYVSDGYINSRIAHLSPEGVFIRSIGGGEGAEPGRLKVPHGIALDSRRRLLVNDSDNKRISVFAADGTFVETWPYASRGGIVVGSDDRVYVSDVNAGAVYILKDGNLLDTISVDARPHGLAVDSDGAIYVSDSIGRKIMKITKPR